MPDGILIIDKPKGLTSAQVVSIIKKRFSLKKVGHGGTLDPLATGVLPICINRATKLSQYLLGSDKIYEGTMLLGVETDTQDVLGKVISEKSISIMDEIIKKEMKKFEGESDQLPPMYSAIKKNGKPLYEYARANQVVERATRKIKILAFDFLGQENNEVRFRIHCSKGTYVRTVCSDLGKILSTYACVKELKRVKSGMLTIQDSITLDKIMSLGDMTVSPHWKSMEDMHVSIQNHYGIFLKKISLQ